MVLYHLHVPYLLRYLTASEVMSFHVSNLSIDKQLGWIMDALHEHKLVGLFVHRVRKRCPDPTSGNFQPHASCEGVHLRNVPSYQAIHVVGLYGEGELVALGVILSSETLEKKI